MSIPKNRWTRLAAWKKAGRPVSPPAWIKGIKRKTGPRLVCGKHIVNYDENANVVELDGNQHLCDDCRDDPLNPANNERGGV